MSTYNLQSDQLYSWLCVRIMCLTHFDIHSVGWGIASTGIYRMTHRGVSNPF